MYDELKERCRACSQGCIYPSECSYFDKPPLRCMRQLLSEAADAIEELQKAVMRLEEESGILDELPMYQQPVGWIPVTERLPKDLTRVIVFCEDGVSYGLCEHFIADDEEVAEWHDFLHYPITPTHWMPLPTPPKEE